MQLVAVDPGKHLCGFAVFCSEGKLQHCGLLDLGGMRTFFIEGRRHSSDVVIEKPQVYPGRKLRGDPNDLIDVALSAGCIAEMARAYGNVVEFVLPRRWKGTRPKDVDNELTFSQMLPHEKVMLVRGCPLKSKRHNVLDAIGIGMWKLGRRP